MELTVKCQKRPEKTNNRALRREGQIPAVLYGHKGTESISLMLDWKEAERLIKKAVVNNTVITLEVPEMSWSGKTLLREVQTHPWKGKPYHLSFFSFATHGNIDMTVPLNFVGTPKGVKNSGGVLDTVITEVTVQGRPDRMPDVLEVDVSGLDVGDALNISDLALPSGVTIQSEDETIIASVVPGRMAQTTESEETTETEIESVEI